MFNDFSIYSIFRIEYQNTESKMKNVKGQKVIELS